MVKKVTPITGGGSGNGNPPDEPSSDKVTASDLANIAKALEGDMDPSDMSPEEIDKLSKAFGKMFIAEMRGEEIEDHIDADQLLPEVNVTVAEAVQKYTDSKGLNLATNINAEQKKVAALLEPKERLKENRNYRVLVQDGYYHFSYSENIFSKYHDYRKSIDRDEAEKALRRVDAEVRNLDPISREELLFTFVNTILGNDVAPSGNYTEPDDFSMLKPESRVLVHDLAQLYINVREHGRVSLKGYDKVNRRFNAASITAVAELTIDDISNFSIHADSIRSVRTIRPKTYYLILQLIKSLSAALPAKLQVALDNMLKEERGVSIDTSTINGRLFNPSKYLRRAFIALMQGRGSFEAFFTALMEVQSILERDLNDRVTAARALIDVYDSLGLDIANVLQHSAKRILSESLL